MIVKKLTIVACVLASVGNLGCGAHPSSPQVVLPPARPLRPPAVVSPAMEICGQPLLDGGPSTPPSGAVRVPAGDDSNVIGQSWLTKPSTTYWFAPGTHTLGSSPYGQIIPQDGDTFVGAPGAILDGQGLNNSAFDGQATGVTIEYLTIQDFVPPGAEYVVNHDDGADWTVKYNTIQDNGDTRGSQLGAAMGLGNGNVVEYNCLTHNGEYGMNAAGTGTVFSHNEVSWNGIAFFPDTSGCGCSGGIKYWDATNATVTDNYIHDNYNVGLWADTDNAGFLIEGNDFANNWAEGITYEISYNADITGNSFVDNGWGVGSYSAGGFPYGDAIYVNGSGGDADVASNYAGTFSVTDNSFTDNWDGVLVYQNPNRLCGSSANSSGGYCTLDDPSVFTTSSCPGNDGGGKPSTSPDYFDECQWKAQNITVTGNTFTFDPADIAVSTPPLPDEDVSRCPTSDLSDTSSNNYWCGFNGMFSFYGSGSAGPSATWAAADAIMDLSGPSGEASYNNHWSQNTYDGPWVFQAYVQGSSSVKTDIFPAGVEATVDFSGWRSIWHQDAGSTTDPDLSGLVHLGGTAPFGRPPRGGR